MPLSAGKEKTKLIKIYTFYWILSIHISKILLNRLRLQIAVYFGSILADQENIAFFQF
jgi:hypothetical protein